MTEEVSGREGASVVDVCGRETTRVSRVNVSGTSEEDEQTRFLSDDLERLL